MAKASLPKIPAISFWRPYWELCFREKLVIDGHAVKTFNVPYHHRGLVLCYSGLKFALGPIRSHGFSAEAAKRLASTDDIIPKGVVGCALISDSRELTEEEQGRLFRGYNNVHDEDEVELALADSDSVFACQYGIFMPLKKLYRFERPFMPPVQHMFGPRGQIPTYDGIMEQLPRWALSEVAKVSKAA